MNYLIVGLGGFLGAVSRFGVYQVEKRFFFTQFPLATFFVNSFGCLLAGVVIGYLQRFSSPHQANINLFLLMGFLGSFTTFSTLGVESYRLISTQSFGPLLFSLLANVIVGIGCVFLGILASSKLFSLT